MTQILIADDEASIRTILAKSMEKKGFQVMRAQTGLQALEILRMYPIDVAIVDIRMPEMTGLELLKHQKSFPSNPSIFVVTAQDTMENAVEAMKRGAYDYLTKPFDLDELSILVDRALETRALKNEVENLKVLQQSSGAPAGPMLVGKSKAIQEIYKTIGKVADQDITVLIQGESGTGKELIARAIHSQGKRSSKPFVAVNCAAIPNNLLEAELFGSKKGAYTGAIADKTGYFERANTGTIFLDEIGDMPMELQAKLLRVLQEKEIQRLGDSKVIPIDVRLIAATNQVLAGRVKKGLFREDLYFRLNVVPLQLPPLRERKNDIRHLVTHFLERGANEFNLGPKTVSKEAMEFLETQNWPGNIRELENLLKRVYVLSSSPVLEKRDFETMRTSFGGDNLPVHDPQDLEQVIARNLEAIIARMPEERDLHRHLLPLIERPLIRIVLQRTQGNQIQAAERLGINRNTLRKKIRDLKVERRGLVERKK